MYIYILHFSLQFIICKQTTAAPVIENEFNHHSVFVVDESSAEEQGVDPPSSSQLGRFSTGATITSKSTIHENPHSWIQNNPENKTDINIVNSILSIGNNPMVVSMCIGLWVLFLPLTCYTYKRTKKDESMVNLIQPAENNPCDKFAYVVTVVTGWRPGAGTTAKVSLCLFGVKGNSQEYSLRNTDNQIFQAGGEDSFLLTTKCALGDLTEIEIWHDNTGASPQWYLGCVIVHDICTSKISRFVHNGWICAEAEQHLSTSTHIIVLPKSTENLKRSRYLFTYNLTKSIKDNHLLVGLFTRPPTLTFTRIHRLVCLFSVFHSMTLLTSILFGKGNITPNQVISVGNISSSMSKILIGVEVGLLSIPIHFIVVMLFKRSHPSLNSLVCIGSKIHGATASVIVDDQHSDYEVEQMQALFKSQLEVKDKVISCSSHKRVAKRYRELKPKTSTSNKMNKDSYRTQMATEEFKSRKKSTNKKKGPEQIASRDKTNRKDSERKPPSKETKGKTRIEGKQNIKKLQNDKISSKKKSMKSSLNYCNKNKNASSAVKDNQCACVEEIKYNYKEHAEDIRMKVHPKITYHSTYYWLPHWCVYLGWVVALALSITSTTVTLMYASTYGYEKSVNWALNVFISFLLLFVIVHPLKILIYTYVGAYSFGSELTSVTQTLCTVTAEKAQMVKCKHRNTVCQQLQKKTVQLASTTLRNTNETKKLLNSEVRLGSQHKQSQRVEYHETMKSYLRYQFDYMLIDLLIYIVFAVCVTLIVYGQVSPHSYRHHKSVTNLVVDGHYTGMALDEVGMRDDLLPYLIKGLLPSLYPISQLYDNRISSETLTADLTTHRVGSIRLRQIRVTNDSCTLSKPFRSTIKMCRAGYSKSYTDSRHYNGSWSILSDDQTRVKEEKMNIWSYHEADILQTRPIYGVNTLYQGAGYVFYMKSTNQLILASELMRLKDVGWLDNLTRAVIIDFTLYNPQVNLFTLCILVFELTAIGNVQIFPQLYTLDLYKTRNYLKDTRTWLDMLFIAIVTVYAVREIMKAFRYGLTTFFSNLYNLLDLVILSMSIAVIVVYWKKDQVVRTALNKLSSTRSDTGFVHLYDAAIWEHACIYLLAVLHMFVVIKFLKLLRFIKRLLTLQMVIRKALPILSHYMIELMIVVMAFAALGHFLFGTHVREYRDLPTAILTQYNFLIGGWEYNMIKEITPHIAPWFFISFVIIGIFFLLSMFLAIINDSITEVHSNKVTQVIEIEVLEYFYFRLKYLFGKATDTDLDVLINTYYKKRIQRVRFA